MTKDTINILMVSNSKSDHHMVKKCFLSEETFNHTLQSAASYETGLIQAKDNTYNILIIDYKLDKKTGLDLVQEIRSHGIDTPAILLTHSNNNLLPSKEYNVFGISRILTKNKCNICVLISVIADTILHFEQEQKNL